MFAYVTPTVSVTLPDFPMLLGNLFLIPPVNVLSPPPPYIYFILFHPERRINRRRGLRHPVWLIWRREISVDSASSRERTLAMPGRERWVLGRERGEEAAAAVVVVVVVVKRGGSSVCRERTAFTHLKKL